MAEPVQNFRTAFHGFNREDVVRFLETATARHTAEVNQLQDDVARLEKELAALREQQTPEVSREELEALRGENTRLKAQIEELEAQLTEPEAPVGDQTNWKDEELAAYRRAETVERQARNRVRPWISCSPLWMGDRTSSPRAPQPCGPWSRSTRQRKRQNKTPKLPAASICVLSGTMW